MKRILTVDDSRAIRLIVAKQIRELGFEVVEAEDGEQGLVKLGEGNFDVVILDVTMPVLDGPGMLAKMRERGDKTPVLMLTSESKRSIIVTLMKLGIEDYILKPFKGEELKAKMLKSLKMTESELGVAAPGDTASAANAPAGAEPTARPSAPGSVKTQGPGGMDVLLVDDMENVEKRLRTFLPAQVTLGSARTSQEAIALCRERSHRVVLVDCDIPGVDSAALMQQMRLLQPHAIFVLLALRSASKAFDDSRNAGFDGVLHKPFDPEEMDEFLLQHLDNQEVVVKDDNILKVAPFRGRETRLERFFTQVSKLTANEVEGIAELIFDISALPVHPERTARMVVSVHECARRVGLELRLVGSPDTVKALKQVSDTATIPIFGSITDAREFEGA